MEVAISRESSGEKKEWKTLSTSSIPNPSSPSPLVFKLHRFTLVGVGLGFDFANLQTYIKVYNMLAGVEA